MNLYPTKRWYENPLSVKIMKEKYLHDGETSHEDLIKRVTGILSESIQEPIAKLMKTGTFFPGGRALYGAGSKGIFNASCSNCYTIGSPADSLDGIFDINRKIANIFKAGGGVGINISSLRPNGARTNNAARTSTGAVSFMHIYDTTGAIIGYHGRRSAILIGMNINHPDIEEFVNLRETSAMKSMNISCLVNDKFMAAVQADEDYELSYFVEATGENFHKTINARKLFNRICEMNWNYGDPGMIFIDTVRQYNLQQFNEKFHIDICNPCVRGNTLILTDTGYHEIHDLVGKKINIWNGFEYSEVVPRITGHDQKMLKISFTNGMSLECTPYHKFVMRDGTRKEAKDLELGDALQKWNYTPIDVGETVDRKIMYTHGFWSGDGTRIDRDGYISNIIALYGYKKELLEYFIYETVHEQECRNLGGGTRLMLFLKDDGIVKFDKTWVPDTKYSLKSRLDWLAGIIDSDGTINSEEGSVAITSIDKKFLKKIQLMVSTLGVSSSVGKGKRGGFKPMPANDGSGLYKFYECNHSYRLVISASNVEKLLALGLETHRVVPRPHTNHNASRFIRVKSIKKAKPADTVYCVTEPKNHTVVFNGIMTGNCGEYFGPAWNSCNLGSLNLYNFVKNKFNPEKATFDFDSFRQAVDYATCALDEILTYGYDLQPLDENRDNIDKWRSIGLGFFGLADMFIAMGVRYGSPESVKLASKITKTMLVSSINASARLASYYNAFGECDPEKIIKSDIIQAIKKDENLDLESIRKFGMRNSQLISIAPTGSLSMLAGSCSSGIEPIFKVSYERTTHGLEDRGITFNYSDRAIADLLIANGVTESMSSEEIKKQFPWVVEAADIDPMDRINVQAAIQEYSDNAISSTVNLPEEATIDDIKEIYMEAFNAGLKGITVFRNNCKRMNILGTKKKKEEAGKLAQISMDSLLPIVARNTIEKPIEGSTYLKHTACVKSMYVTVNHDENGNIFEVFTNKSVNGCTANIATITRMTSMALRMGAKVTKIIEELKENNCQACLAVIKDHPERKLSRSCPYAIAEALEAEYKKLHPDAEIKEDTNGMMECPQCHSKTLVAEGRCYSCKKCGWSRCD